MNQLEITDLFKGAYFLTCSARIKEARLVGRNQVRFIIEGENLAQEEELYQTGNASVDPLKLKACLDFLREKLTQTLRTGTENWRDHGHHQQRRVGQD
jgi:hypothetical protein